MENGEWRAGPGIGGHVLVRLRGIGIGSYGQLPYGTLEQENAMVGASRALVL
jgi:hypothetical protein